MLSADITELERELDGFQPSARRQALEALAAVARRGEVALPEPGEWVNIHVHTFFSYNSYGYSPSRFAWLARKAGLAVAGIVDFDVLHGLEEFRDAGRLLGLKTCVGVETRVYVPEFADTVINSPGEPGISYHMGVGFPDSDLTPRCGAFIAGLRGTAEERNRGLVERVNGYLDPIVLDYDRDVLPLTPAGNATERHICLAYARRAATVFEEEADLARFWSGKLGMDVAKLDPPEGHRLQLLIRERTMKQGGVGYVQPDRGSFPKLADTSEFVLAASGISTHTWLDGTSEGERHMPHLLEVMMRAGVDAINVIPDRNYTAGRPDEKLRNLREVVAVAQGLDLLVVAGTEINSFGQKLVDDFSSAELAPMLPVFLQSAYAIYAHSVLQREAGLGYTSAWARRQFPARRERNRFFAAVGRELRVDSESVAADLSAHASPDEVLSKVKGRP